MQRAIIASWNVRAAAARAGSAGGIRLCSRGVVVVSMVVCAAAPLRSTLAQPAAPGRAAAPAAGKPAEIPAPGGTTVVRNDGEDYSGPTLPKNYRPPRAPSEVMTIEKELLTKDEEEETRKRLFIKKFPNVLRTGELNNTTRPILQEGARWSVYRLSMIRHRDDVHDLRDKLSRDCNLDPALLLAKTGADGWKSAKPFREFYLQEITNRAAELLDGNFHVRLNAVLLLSELTIKGDSDNKIPDEAFTPAFEPLVKVVEDKDQPEAIKIHAVRGLARILAMGKPKVDDRLRIGLALASELKRTDTHFWYQMRLAEAMGALDAVIDRNRKPYAAQTLMEVLVDKGRHCIPRSEAARSLGRIPLDGDVNLALVAFEVVHLAEQLSDAYNKDPSGIYWRDAYFKIYLAFRPRDTAGLDRGDGLLTKVEKPAYAKHKAAVTEAYNTALPLVKHVVSSKEAAAFPEGALPPVVDWLKKKQPSDYRVAPNLDPITAQDGGKQPADVKPAG